MRLIMDSISSSGRSQTDALDLADSKSGSQKSSASSRFTGEKSNQDSSSPSRWSSPGGYISQSSFSSYWKRNPSSARDFRRSSSTPFSPDLQVGDDKIGASSFASMRLGIEDSQAPSALGADVASMDHDLDGDASANHVKTSGSVVTDLPLDTDYDHKQGTELQRETDSVQQSNSVQELISGFENVAQGVQRRGIVHDALRSESTLEAFEGDETDKKQAAEESPPVSAPAPPKARVSPAGRSMEDFSKVFPSAPERSVGGMAVGRRRTVPQPFNLATDRRASSRGPETPSSPALKTPRRIQIRASFGSPQVPPKPSPRPTTSPEPFNLASIRRHEEAQERLQAEKAAKEQEADERRHFRAQPILLSAPLPAVKGAPPTSSVEFKFASDKRAEKRREGKVDAHDSAAAYSFKATPLPAFYRRLPHKARCQEQVDVSAAVANDKVDEALVEEYPRLTVV